MKKNKMMRLASVLLVAVLLTTSVISGTFAKYTTSATSEDSARVAKWGVAISTTGNTFGGAYANVENGNGVSTTYNATVDSVRSAGGNVVAPGTKGTMAAFSVTGTPEVDVHVKYEATLALNGWEIGTPASQYCPIVFAVKDTTGNTTTYGTTVTTAEKNTYTTVAELIAAVEAAIEANTADYEALTNLNTINDDISVSWEWPFETGADASAKANNNIKDTALGDLLVAPTVTLNVTVIVEQVD